MSRSLWLSLTLKDRTGLIAASVSLFNGVGSIIDESVTNPAEMIPQPPRILTHKLSVVRDQLSVVCD
jgi:hypothetical protein